MRHLERQVILALGLLAITGVTFGQNATTAAPVEAKGLNRESYIIIGVVSCVAIITIGPTLVLLCTYRRKKGENEEEGSPLETAIEIPGPGTASLSDVTLEKRRLKEIEAENIVEEVTVQPDPKDHETEKPVEAPPPVVPPREPKVTEIPIRTSDVGSYIDRLNAQDGGGGLEKEFMQIAQGQTKPWEIGVIQTNFPKNQFVNIIAYDFSRVVLKATDNKKSGHGYINANYIPGYGGRERAYIATQGPKDNTIGDFWEMVWQEGVTKIVMLTGIREGDKIKCSRYWPTDKASAGAKYGMIVVKTTESFEFADYTVRKFIIKHESQDLARMVTQYHFTDWPDHGVPTASSALLDFRLKVRAEDEESRGPLLLHCSAGVGRTGTFLTLDWSLEKAEAEGIVDVFALVKLLREYRVNMVQTLAQYIFVYDSLRLILEPGLTAVPRYSINEAMATLHQRSGDRGTRLQRQYHCLELCRGIYPTAVLEGCSTENLSKNRSTDVVPQEQHRPALAINGHFTSDYINAAYVNGYRHPLAFLVTQWPLPETVPDIWRMLYDHQSCALVLLNGLDARDETCRMYWPASEDEPLVFGSLSVELKEHQSKEGLVRRTFRLIDADRSGEDATMLVEQYHMTTWAANRELPHSMQAFCRLVAMLVAWRRENEEGIITVQCRSGVKQSGLLLAALYLLDKLHYDDELDVPLAVAQIRKTRPQLIETYEQYSFLYEFARNYIRMEDNGDTNDVSL